MSWNKDKLRIREEKEIKYIGKPCSFDDECPNSEGCDGDFGNCAYLIERAKENVGERQ